MNQTGRRGNGFQPLAEPMEGRLLFSTGVKNPLGFQAQRPNTPVLPFAAATKTATFIDTTARILHGAHVIVGTQTYIAPFVGLNASTGFIRIGSNDDIRDNSTIISNPSRIRSNPP